MATRNTRPKVNPYCALFREKTDRNGVVRRFRFDTRIYLSDDCQPAELETSGCVGAVVGKNPGSAGPTALGTWGPAVLGTDKMLPSVRNPFIEAYRQAGKSIPQNAFVQVWNLFYLCDKEPKDACLAVQAFDDPPPCQSENDLKPRVVSFAWGGGNDSLARQLGQFKKRFQPRGYADSFYYGNSNSFGWDDTLASIVRGIPGSSDFAKHTQGLTALPIVNHLATLL